MVNYIVCDDNALIRKKVEEIITTYMMKNKLRYKTYMFSDYNKKFLEMINKKMGFKIYILDIETPSLSGIDIARQIRKFDIQSVIIFLTGHEELGSIVLKNELLFLSFINKFDDCENRLISSIKLALQCANEKRILRFEEGGILYTISADDIMYITRDSIERKSIIKTDYSEFKSYKPLNTLIELLDERFIKTHRACFVNKNRVVAINKQKGEITFDNGEVIDLLSKRYKKELI